MKRMMLLYALCMVANMSCAQRTCVVADMFTHIPVRNVKVIADHYESKAVRTNYKGEFDIISSDFKHLTFIANGYMRRVLSREEIGDTVLLLSNDNRLDEVVIYGREPMKGSAVGSWGAKLREQGKSMPKPSGHDFLDIFRRKVSSKKRKERMKAIENY